MPRQNRVTPDGTHSGAWTPGGYLSGGPPASGDTVTVITPRATVPALAAGYRPVIHPSAAG